MLRPVLNDVTVLLLERNTDNGGTLRVVYDRVTRILTLYSYLNGRPTHYAQLAGSQFRDLADSFTVIAKEIAHPHFTA